MKAVIFDVGGVLYHSGSLPYKKEMERELGLQQGELEKIVYHSISAEKAMIGQATRQEMWHKAQQNLGISPAKMRRVQNALLPGNAWDNELLAFAKSLKRKCKTAILSDVWEGAREALGEVVDPEIFDVYVFSYEVGVRKPDPRMYEVVLEKLEIDPEQAMFIDDKAKNVVGVQVLGIHAVQYESRNQVITAVLDWLE